MKKILFFLLLSACTLSARGQEPQSIVVSRYDADMQEIETEITPHKKWWFGLDGAYSYRVAKAADGAYSDFVNKMRSGFAYGADIHYAFSRGFQFGARFTGHRYAHEEMMLKDQVSTLYFAPSFIWKNYNRNDTGAFVFGCSVGYVSFKEKVNAVSYSKGGLGSTVDIGYDFRLSGDYWLALKLTLTAGSIDTGLKDAQNKKVIESLSALDIGVGIRF